MAARTPKGARKLKSNVWVGDPAQFLVAGSTPPKELAELITNPNAWADGEDQDSVADSDA